MSAHRAVCCLFTVLVAPFFASSPAPAQEGTLPLVVEETTPALDLSSEAQEPETPTRLAYFSFISGEVLWRIDPEAFDASALSDSAATPESETALEENFEWQRAEINLPLRAGMEVLVPVGGKAEICFDDGSLIRLGSDSHFALETMTADEESEFTGLRLDKGLATLKLRHDNSLFQLQAQSTSVRARGPASIRVDASTPAQAQSTGIAVRAGRAFIENEIGSVTLRAGQFLQTAVGDVAFTARRLPPADSWEQWNLTRDEFWNVETGAQETAAQESSTQSQNLPENLALVSGDLARYGDWRDDTEHGRVWQPRVSTSDWQPYSAGRWNWVFPFGWTWVSSEPWGWAPYHYGTWINRPYGWAWVPGPAWQPWSPGVVSFFYRSNQRCWAPLSPHEVRYPRAPRRSWHRRFSIYRTAVYYPTSYGYCEPRMWNTPYVNYVTNITYVTYLVKVKKSKKINFKHPDKKFDKDDAKRRFDDRRFDDRQRDNRHRNQNGTRVHRVRLEGAPDEAFDSVIGVGSRVDGTHTKQNDSHKAANSDDKPNYDSRTRNQKPAFDFKNFVPRHARVHNASLSPDKVAPVLKAGVAKPAASGEPKKELPRSNPRVLEGSKPERPGTEDGADNSRGKRQNNEAKAKAQEQSGREVDTNQIRRDQIEREARERARIENIVRQQQLIRERAAKEQAAKQEAEKAAKDAAPADAPNGRNETARNQSKSQQRAGNEQGQDRNREQSQREQNQRDQAQRDAKQREREQELRQREAQQREAQQREAQQREMQQREREQQEARQREARQREAQQREQQREAQQREAQQREAQQREAQQREAQQREEEQRARNRRQMPDSGNQNNRSQRGSGRGEKKRN